MTIDVYGILDSGAEPPCPVCGEPLGYYAEFGDEIGCGNCGCKMKLDYETIIHYEIYEVGKGYKLRDPHKFPFCGLVERVDI
jgi:hypothetical protein